MARFSAGISPEALARAGAEAPKPARNGKYNAQKAEYNGITYDSKLEARVAERLDLLVKSGHVTHWERQQEFELHAGIKYRSDFIVHYATGKPRTLDAKGVSTAVFRLKRRLFEADYGPLDVVNNPEDVPLEGRP